MSYPRRAYGYHKKFDGKEFHNVAGSTTKANARKVADNYRRKGMNVRVVESKRQGSPPYYYLYAKGRR